MITHMSLAKLAKRININMRCIEIAFGYPIVGCKELININMRCIEITETTKNEPTSYD